MTVYKKDVGAKLLRVVKDVEILTSTANLTTAAGYVDVAGTKIDALYADNISFIVNNLGATNGATWKLVGSHDDSTYVDANTPANLALSTTATGTSVAYYRYYKIQAKDQSGGSHTSVSASIMAK